ncbi:protein phosphatase 1 regulatory subunit 14D isoform X2 [Bos mutus]|uniref:protein phosphatase 1 regulatory subunit 14D isoform X2 n=1 Tax=Bos mutus TaxID=72004 RepID=UPI0038B5D340
MGGPRSTNIPGVKKGRRARCSHTHFGDPAAGRTAKELTYPDTRTGAEQRARHAPNPLRLLLALLGPGYLRSPSMLSSSPASCTSPNPDKENPSKKVHWASGRRRTSSTDSESKSQSDPFRPRSRKPSRLTVKYDRGQLQRWVEMEQWVDTQVQELFQDQPTSSEPEIDLEALMELSTEEQKTQLEALLQNCPRPTEVRDALVVWAKRGPSGPAASEEEGLALGPSPLS